MTPATTTSRTFRIAVALALALGTREGSSRRGGDLATLTESSAEGLIDEAVRAAAAEAGVTVAPVAAAATGGGAVDAAAVNELRETFHHWVRTVALPIKGGVLGDAVAYAELPLLDRWMLQRTAALIDSVSGDFERFEFYRFFQALQNFCVVDLSNVYLDIAKDRLYVSGAADFRRRSCQTVLALVVMSFALIVAVPVLYASNEDSGRSNRLILLGGIAWVALVLVNWGMSFFVV